MGSNAQLGRVSFASDRQFNGVKVFSATMVSDRDRLGEKVTEWLDLHPDVTVCDIVVTQSRDQAFHCLAITVFFWEDVEKRR